MAGGHCLVSEELKKIRNRSVDFSLMKTSFSSRPQEMCWGHRGSVCVLFRWWRFRKGQTHTGPRKGYVPGEGYTAE